MTDTQLKTNADRIEQLEKRVDVLEDYLDLVVLQLVDEAVMTLDQAKKRFPELPWLTQEELDAIREYKNKQP
jgi:hypothetical protein